ncbi:hypothetical protein [Microbacterium sp.]|uniref:hypothetical protein n=1 Tax=Microbacterium sp. TaxID=51671 RepID=UPI003C76C3F5
MKTAIRAHAATADANARQKITDRLGLPESATNAEVLAAVDARLQPKFGRPAPAREPDLSDSAIWARMHGAAETPAPRDMSEDAIWARMHGAAA